MKVYFQQAFNSIKFVPNSEKHYLVHALDDSELRYLHLQIVFSI